MRCSLRIWILSTSAALFVLSLLFTFFHNDTENPVYMEGVGWTAKGHRVRLLPGYQGVKRHPQTPRLYCACRQCLRQPGFSAWFDSHYNTSISPVWTLKNLNLSLDVQRWWMMLQPQFRSQNTTEILSRLFQIIPGKNPYEQRDPMVCCRCAVVGNSGNLRGSGYGKHIDSHNFIMRINQGPTLGYENDVGCKTTHHFMYPESAKNLATNVSFVLVPFKALDLVWITSALSTGNIRFTYAPVKAFLRVDKDKVQIFNPAFFKYIHDKWTNKKGRYPSTGMLALFFALHTCDEVNVFGFGADNRGNWHHYWENNRYAGEFRKTGVHNADYEANLIDTLAQEGKIRVYRST